MYSFNMKDGNVTVLGQKTEFVGELEFSDNLVITGTFEGRIQSSGNLRIDKTAQCKVSQIAADSIFVAGAVTGDLKAASKLEASPDVDIFSLTAAEYKKTCTTYRE